MQIIRFAKFGLVGCSGIVVDFSITWLCKEKLHWNKYLSSSLGFCCAVVNNYILNKYFTFQNKDADIASQFVKFLIISVIGLLLSTFFLFLLQKKSHINFYLSKALVIALVFLWNFGANTLYTFKQ